HRTDAHAAGRIRHPFCSGQRMRAEERTAIEDGLVIDYYLSGIARCAWPEADVTYTKRQRQKVAGKWCSPDGSRGTDYRLWGEGLGDGTRPSLGLGTKFRDAK